mmetsp:Transcript_19626/g.39318  ORF Transcript_19626/g.39318 Transcript_19626/m.39318 type:complete len:858 (+) Transcript_19626:44-2617(+)
MGSIDSIDRNNTAELDVLLGAAKDAARIPLPPSLSVASTEYSIKTEYYNKRSDVRDETHHVDMVIDSMREGAEDISQSKSCMSDLTDNVQLSKSRSSLRSKASGVSNIEDIAVDSSQLANSMSLGSNRTPSVTGTASKEVPITRSRSTQKDVEEIPLDLLSSLSSKLSKSSRTSSKEGDSTGIPLTLSKSRSTQSTKSTSSKQAKAASINNLSLLSSRSGGSTLSMPRSTSTSSKASAVHVEKSSSQADGDEMPLDLLNSMSLSSQKSSKGGDSTGIPLTLSKSRSTQSTKSTSSKQSKAEATNNLSLLSSRSGGSTLSMPRSTSTSSKASAVHVEKSSSQADVDEIPLDVPNSMSSVSRKSSKGVTLSKSRSTQSTKSTSSKEAAPESTKSVSSPMVYTALEGNVLWSIMNDEMPHDLSDEPLTPPSVPPSASTSSSTSRESLDERAAAGLPALTPRADSAVAEDEDEDSVFAKVQSVSHDVSLKNSSSLTEKAGNTKWRVEEGQAIWDNSIEMSYSDMINFMDEPNKEEVVGDSSFAPSTNTPVPTRKKVRWSKFNKIFSGRSKSTGAAGEEKKAKTKSILKRFQKKKIRKEEHQDKLSQTIDNTNEVEEPSEDGVCGEFEWAVEYDSIEKSFKDGDTNEVKEVNDDNEDAESKETELEAEAAVEPSTFAPAMDSPVASNNLALCSSKPAWAEAMCNFHEAKAAMFALTGRWNADSPKAEEWAVPETQLDINKARDIIVAANQLYSQRKLIEDKSAELKKQEELTQGAQTVASYQAGLEKTGTLVNELSDAKRLEESTFVLVKSLFNSLSSEERGYAVVLGDNIARAAKEVESFQCEASLEVEMSLPEGWSVRGA